MISPNHKFEYLKARPKLEKSLERKKAFKTFPAALVFIVADNRIPLSLESAQYALYNMILNRSKFIWNVLGLKKYEKIFSTMGLGYPVIKFKNKVLGKKIDIQWNGSKY